jgi:hypothetical protein
VDLPLKVKTKIIPLAVLFSTLALARGATGADAAAPSPPADPTDHWGLANSGAATRLEQVIWSGNEFVAAGGTMVASSTDGLHWTAANPDGLTRNLRGIASNGTLCVVVGDRGTIMTSSDLKSWTKQTSGETKRFTSVFWLGNKFVVMGDSGVNVSSPDGETWTSGAPYNTVLLTHGTWNGSKLVLGGGNNLFESDDGSAITTLKARTGPMTDVTWGNNFFVAVGNNKSGVLTSPDGVTWTKQDPGVTSILQGVCWTGTRFVAVGDQGVVLTSPDGNDWSRIDLGGNTANLTSVAGNGSVCVAVSETGAILSTNSHVPLPATSDSKAGAFAGPLPGDQIKALVLITGDIGAGTGFVAKMHNQFFIVTNQHVLSANNKFTITGMDGTKYPTDGALYGAAANDVAILRIPDGLAKYSLEIMDDPLTNAKVGNPVTVPGNSFGAGVPLQINGKLLAMGPELVEVDAKFVPGNSGSPIIDRPSGQVIGIATMTYTYKSDVAQKYNLTSSIRWFGYRLDNIDPKTGWQKLDWTRFREEGVKIDLIENLTNVMIAVLQKQPLPPVIEPSVQQAISEFNMNLAQAIKQNNQQAYVGAYKLFDGNMHNLAVSDFQDLSDEPVYLFHAQKLKELQAWQDALDTAYAAYENTLAAQLSGQR